MTLELEPRPPPAIDMHALEAMLRELRRLEGFRIGAREEIAVARILAELIARGAVSHPREIRPFLAPILARTEVERAQFDAAFERWFPEEGAPSPYEAPAETTPVPPPRRLGPRLAGAGVGLLVALVVGVGWFWSQQRLTETPAPAPVERSEPQPRAAEESAPPPEGARSEGHVDVPLNAVWVTSRPFGHAPTLRELAREPRALLAQGLPDAAALPNFTADDLTRRLSALAGLPEDEPQPLAAEPWRLARLAYAVALIREPGRQASPAQFEIAAEARAAEIGYGSAPPAADAQPADRTEIRAVNELHAIMNAASAAPTLARLHDDPDGRGFLQRGLALWNLRHDPDVVIDDPNRLDDTPPWLTPIPESARAPFWTPWAAVLFAFALLALWLSNTLERRKAYLRRRPPDYPPAVHELVARAPRAAPVVEAVLQKAATALQQWTERETDRLDIARTIDATILSGQFTPAYGRARSQPDYLLLIECRGSGDMETQRLRALAHHLQARSLNLTIYYYEREPLWVYPELARAGVAETAFAGAPVHIDDLAHRYPDFRLIVLGAGQAFVDPLTLELSPGAEALRAWPARAMLSPTPITEWGPREFSIAHGLAMPIGRSTEEGLAGLGRMLGLGGGEARDLLALDGDGRARALPERLRERLTRWSMETPASDIAWAELERELRRYLDTDAFIWLGACSVYPELRWDLTLFLGLSIRGLDGDPLYREDRLAALTQLPWLREGRMPDWLRARLIESLGERGRAVRETLRDLVEATKRGGAPIDDALKLRLATVDPGAAEPIEDVIFLEFLAKADVTDLEVSWLDPLKRLLPPAARMALDKVGIALIFTAGLCALLAFVISPAGGRIGLFDNWNRADGALPEFAFVPLVILSFAAPAALALIDRAGARAALRQVLAVIGGAALAALVWRLGEMAGLEARLGGRALAPFILAGAAPFIASWGAGLEYSPRAWKFWIRAVSIWMLLPLALQLTNPFGGALAALLISAAFAVAALIAARLLAPPRFAKLRARRGRALHPAFVIAGVFSLGALVVFAWWTRWEASRPFPLLDPGEVVTAQVLRSSEPGIIFAEGTSAGEILTLDYNGRRELERVSVADEPIVDLARVGACTLFVTQSGRVGALNIGARFGPVGYSAARPILSVPSENALAAIARTARNGAGEFLLFSCTEPMRVLDEIAVRDPATALFAIGPGRWVVGADDGRVRLLRAEGGALSLDPPVVGIDLDRPILAINSARGALVLAADNDNAAAPNRAFVALVDDRLVVAEDMGEQAAPTPDPAAEGDEAAYRQAAGENTPAAYRDYLAAYPQGAFVAQARAALDELDADAWRNAAGADTPQPYRLYLAQHPEGASAQLARNRLTALETEAWEVARRSATRVAYDAFLRDFPESARAAEARQQIAALEPPERGLRPPPPTETDPPACPASDFVIYFEWDRSALVSAALETLDAAVNRARQCTLARVLVVGHTDTSQTAEYAMGLSERQASVVRDALVARGVPANLITTEARGETDLARATADGVREPLNRRVAVTMTFR